MKKGQMGKSFFVVAFLVLALAMFLLANNILIIGKVTQEDTIVAKPIPMIVVYILLGFIVIATVALVVLSYILSKKKENKISSYSTKDSSMNSNSYENKPNFYGSSKVEENNPLVEKQRSPIYNRVSKLIAKTEGFIESGDKSLASKAYSDVEKAFKNLNREDKKELFEKAKSLYERISQMEETEVSGES
jgi:hypothetical protein